MDHTASRPTKESAPTMVTASASSPAVASTNRRTQKAIAALAQIPPWTTMAMTAARRITSATTASSSSTSEAAKSPTKRMRPNFVSPSTWATRSSIEVRVWLAKRANARSA